MEISTAIIIRLHYKDDKEFYKRLSFFRTLTLPSILRQTDQDFDICIWCEDKHKEVIESLNNKIKTFNVTKLADYPEHRHKKGFHIDFTYWEDVVGLDKYDIQLGLDSDDIIFPEYVEKAKEALQYVNHVSFQPYIFELPTLKTYTCPIIYTEERGSALFGIKPDKDNYIFAYEQSHLQLPKILGSSKVIQGHCAFTVHENNTSTYLYKGSKQIQL